MKKQQWLILFLVLALCVGLFAGCGKKTPTYTVTFDPNGGDLVSGSLTQTVEEGKDAVLPQVSNGKKVVTWDDGWRNVTSDRTVTAQWAKVAMDTADLAEYVQDRTVTVNVKDFLGGESTGSGFFIDSEGTVITNFHVIDMASEITVEAGNGASYPVEKIVDFSNIYDLAILKIDVTNMPYLDFADAPVRTGEQVYAVGSALGILTGSFTGGIVSSVRRTYGMIECIQMDAAISPGNSGGPLVNAYGEVVGINTASYTNGESLNLAIKPSTLDNLSMDKNWTVREFKEWYEQESSRSWSPWYYDNNENIHYVYSLVNNYQTVTGVKCLQSHPEEGDPLNGYKDCCLYYVYNYKSSEYDAYVNYLKSVGFEYQNSESQPTWSGTSYYYYNEKDNIKLDLYVLNDFSKIWIYPTLE